MAKDRIASRRPQNHDSKYDKCSCSARGFPAMAPDKRGTVSCGKRLFISGAQEISDGCFRMRWNSFRGESLEEKEVKCQQKLSN